MGSAASYVVLDTHAWLWWTSAERKLSRSARAAIDGAETIGVSSMSCFEVAMLAERGRLELDEAVQRWVDRALSLDRVREVAVDGRIAVNAALLERAGFHMDPFDMVVYATAEALDARLVTKDRRIRDFDPVRTVW